jgi:hypothetical protein
LLTADRNECSAVGIAPKQLLVAHVMIRRQQNTARFGGLGRAIVVAKTKRDCIE